MKVLSFLVTDCMVDEVKQRLPEGCVIVDEKERRGEALWVLSVECDAFPENSKPVMVCPEISRNGDVVMWDWGIGCVEPMVARG